MLTIGYIYTWLINISRNWTYNNRKFVNKNINLNLKKISVKTAIKSVYIQLNNVYIT